MWKPNALSAALSALLLGLALCNPGKAAAQQSADRAQAQRIEVSAQVREASQRFGIPEHWIYAVIRIESAGRTRAVSSAGAMGLMQLMPGTWARQRDRYALGSDPFDPRDNILAGTSYLREMYDLYGIQGFLAAYNAGPGRYEAWLAGRRNLPLETRRYVAKLAPLLHRDRIFVADSAQTLSSDGSVPDRTIPDAPDTETASGPVVPQIPVRETAHDLFVPVSTVSGQ